MPANLATWNEAPWTWQYVAYSLSTQSIDTASIFDHCQPRRSFESSNKSSTFIVNPVPCLLHHFPSATNSVHHAVSKTLDRIQATCLSNNSKWSGADPCHPKLRTGNRPKGLNWFVSAFQAQLSVPIGWISVRRGLLNNFLMKPNVGLDLCSWTSLQLYKATAPFFIDCFVWDLKFQADAIWLLFRLQVSSFLLPLHNSTKRTLPPRGPGHKYCSILVGKVPAYPVPQRMNRNFNRRCYFFRMEQPVNLMNDSFALQLPILKGKFLKVHLEESFETGPFQMSASGPYWKLYSLFIFEL